MSINEADMARWHRESVEKEWEAAKASKHQFHADQDAAGARLKAAKDAYVKATEEWDAALKASEGAFWREQLARADVKKVTEGEVKCS